MRTELYVAHPPTSKCRQLIDLSKTLLEEHPGRIRLVVYERGMMLTEEPSPAFMGRLKILKIPAIFINGRFVCEREIPARELLSQVTRQELRRGREFDPLRDGRVEK